MPRSSRPLRSCCLCVLSLALGAGTAIQADPHTRMMQATFKIVGQSKKTDGAEEAAAAFAVALPDPATSPRIALVTTAHFFDNIRGGRFKLIARRRLPGGRYEKADHPIAIADGSRGTGACRRDTEADLAVVAIARPHRLAIEPLPIETIATTEALAAVRLHPGRRVFALGYPFAIEGNQAGFPVLRGGHIASFPLQPTGPAPTFLVDMAVSEGMSGAPVYVVVRSPRSADAKGRARPLVIGTIVRQHHQVTRFNGPFERREVLHPLNLAVARSSLAIRRLLDSLCERE